MLSRLSHRLVVCAGIVLLGASYGVASDTDQLLREDSMVFPACPDNHPNYRIPAIVQTPSGDLLVFVEKRNSGIGDVGDTDIVMKRSGDLGRHWQPEHVLFDKGFQTHTDITVLMDEKLNRVWLFFLMDKKVFSVMWSDDEGLHWTEPTSIHEQIIPPAWDQVNGSTPQGALPADPPAGVSKKAQWSEGWRQRYGIGPGSGAVRLQAGSHAGRIVVPARAQAPMEGSDRSRVYTFAFYSDDDGQTWQRGDLGIAFGGEQQFVELPGGELMANARDSDRSNLPDRSCRRIAVSSDGGQTWGSAWMDRTLVEPQCHGAVDRYSRDGYDLLLFVNPNSSVRTEKYPYGRNNLSIRISETSGKTWDTLRTVYSGPSSYADMCVLQDGTVGIVYECGPEDSVRYWDQIAFTRVNLPWIYAESTPDKPGDSN